MVAATNQLNYGTGLTAHASRLVALRSWPEEKLCATGLAPGTPRHIDEFID